MNESRDAHPPLHGITYNVRKSYNTSMSDTHLYTPRRLKQQSRQPQPANNFLDILFVVFEFLDRRADQLSLIQTQRDIYDLKAPTLLKGVVRITDVFRLDSFNSFMLGAPSARFPRLTHLAVDVPSWSIRDKPAAFFTFIQVLSYARYLEELSLEDCEQWFGISPRLPNVLSSLQSLRMFRLVDAGEKACDMLSLSRSPLNRLDIAFSARKNVEAMMKNLSSTLQELRITETELHLSQSPYPNLTSLVLNNWWTIEVRPLIQLFPNLRRLSYESTTSNTNRRMGAAEAWMYWANVTAQPQRVTWGPPDYLRGDPTTLFTLAPRWRVHHLDITSLTRAGLAEFGAVFFETKPRCLSVEIPSGEFPQVARALRGYWAQPEAAQLTTLRVSIMIDILERDRTRVSVQGCFTITICLRPLARTIYSN